MRHNDLDCPGWYLQLTQVTYTAAERLGPTDPAVLFFLASPALNTATAKPVLIFNELQRNSQLPNVIHHMNADRRPGAEFKGRRQSDDPANTLFAVTGPFAVLTDPVLLFEGSKIKNGNIAGLDTAHDSDLIGNLREIVFRVQKGNVSDRVATSTLTNSCERISSDPVGINPRTRHWTGCYDRRWRAGCASRVQGTLLELDVFSGRLRLGDSHHGEYLYDRAE